MINIKRESRFATGPVGMAHHGSQSFEAYAKNLRRIYWAEFIDAQLRATRPERFRASIVAPALPETDELSNAFDYHRFRASTGE